MSDKVKPSTPIQQTISNHVGTVEDVRLKRDFGTWGILSIAWNMVNIFGGMSYIFVVGFSAGGIPSIFYGFIGSSFCVLCIMATLAECASMFPTAGGAYHFATFLAPEKYRRYISYPLGWLNYLGWVFTIASCSAIATWLTFSLVNLCKPEVSVTTRWQLFLVYIAWSVGLNHLTISLSLGAASMVGFVGFVIALLARSPKADTAFAFKDIVNETGYSTAAMAVVLGLYNSMVAFICLDAACHMAEELPHPAVQIPRVLYITMATQFTVGVIYIFTIGFSITDINVIIKTPTGVPIIEVVRQGLKSDAAAIVFNVVLLINFMASTTGAMLASSRQGYALARDGGLFFKQALTKIQPRFMVPLQSLNLCFGLSILIGIVYLFSTQAFNALLGAEALFMLLSYAPPSLMMLIFGRAQLKTTKFSLHRLGYFYAGVAVVYTAIVTVLVMIPQVHPVTASNMNYTILFAGSFAILCLIMWVLDARKSYKPPTFEQFVVNVAPPEDRGVFVEGDNSHHKHGVE
ncbi:Choline transport protein [Fusarium falciforme]|uniref:Choline transport protein n=1 Tax=Fusarium falciforme TaxID=195108 RepID=UPI002301336E|nr:Choline transport protein [Fusarium falciforme]WAO93423.1 Choline transport protein [Fusarium falciforme]